MIKKILFISIALSLWIPRMVYSENAKGMPAGQTATTTEELQPGSGSPTLPERDEIAQPPAIIFPKQWYVVERIPSAKGLAIGVFLFEEGMPTDHIRYVFGEPEQIIPGDGEGHGPIWVSAHDRFFFSASGYLENVEEIGPKTGS